jgi:acetoacetyl-CoA synthetase
MPMFVVLAEGEELNAEVIAALRTSIRRRCSPRHVPDKMIAV